MRAAVLLMLSLGLLGAGCAGVETGAPGNSSRRHYASDRMAGGVLVGRTLGEVTRSAVERGVLKVDAFEKVLVLAGLDDLEALPSRTRPLTPGDAARLLGRLLAQPVTLDTFPPRLVAGHLLREVLEGGEASREEMLRRVERFKEQQVAVLRPDGYLAWALDGRTQQKVASVQWRDGAFRAFGFELGRFYGGKGGVFRLLDARLEVAAGKPMAEVHDDADVLSRTLDGAEEAFLELVLAVGQLLTTPPQDTLAALGRLPEGVRALIQASPEYLERFAHMTRGEQVKAVAKLVTSLVATWGAASATTRTVAGTVRGLEGMVPVLSLSAEGTLALERVAVPVKQMATVVSGGPGAALILQRANTSGGGDSSSGGPGRWKPSKEHMAEPARRYQAQITQAPEGHVYAIGEVSFDGFKDGVLLEAKGPGYEKFLGQSVEEGGWFEGFLDMVEQAKRQHRVANGHPIEWYFAERAVADHVRASFRRNGLGRIPVHFKPPE